MNVCDLCFPTYTWILAIPCVALQLPTFPCSFHFPTYTLIMKFSCVALQFPTFPWSFHDPCAMKHFHIYTLILAFLCLVLQLSTFSWFLAESNRFYIIVATHVLFTCFYFYFLIFEKYMLLFKWPCELFLAWANSYDYELRASFYCC